MHIGIDFDNTIVCYDALFHNVCVEKGLIPADIPVNKSDVRNYLRRIGKEDSWTEMQGYVYGARMSEAVPYPGAIEFITAACHVGTKVSIISHKTRYPFLGPQYDLHETSTKWLEKQGFFDPDRVGLAQENVFFELTKEEKIGRIQSAGVTHFIDDLPEFLGLPSFPVNVHRILFDPNGLYPDEKNFTRATSWMEIRKQLSR